MEPDYGLMLHRQSLGNVPQYFYGLELVDLCRSEAALYTSFQSRKFGDSWYGASFDFGLEQVAALLGRCPPDFALALARFLRHARPGQTIDFSEPIVVDVETRLGTLQRGVSGEEFIPLVVVRIFPP